MLAETLTIESNTALIIVAIIGAIGVISSGFLAPVMISWMGGRQRAIERAEDRADRLLVATKVDNVASAVHISDDARTAVLGHIAKTGDATHAIVNNQRTVMLRSLAIMARRLAVAFPDDPILQKAADDAEHDLAMNVIDNADPATKAPFDPNAERRTPGDRRT